MTRPQFAQLPSHLTRIRQAALHAVDPGKAVRRTLHMQRDGMRIGHHTIALRPTSRVYLIAFGKAAPAMACEAAEILGSRLTLGMASVPHGTRLTPPARVTFVPAGHPLPDRGSLAAGAVARRLLAETRAGDLVIVLISGGGSAMLEDPRPGVRLADLRWLNQALIGCGAPIQDINVVRSAISTLKGGGLARLAAPARVVSLILSDVIGDRLSSIASGPTIHRRRSGPSAREVLRRAGLWERCPASIVRALTAPEPAHGAAPRPIHVLIGSNRLAVEAAEDAARRIGFRPRVVTHRLHGEAHVVGERLARRLRAAPPGTCLILGGETTVTLRGRGRGGRNQELALAAAAGLEGMQGIAVMALATDGVDGPTDAAGAVITGKTARILRRRGIEIAESLARNDSYPALLAAGALLRIGPSGTNVGDIIVGLRYE
jgi:glycerate 2-kinase